MAITHVGKSSAMASGTGAISVGVAASATQGDLLILILEGYDAIPAEPSGWTTIDTQTNTNCNLRVCRKIHGASESAVSVADSGNSTRGLMVAFRNAVYHTSVKSTDTGTTYASTSPTTTQNGAMIVYCLGFFDADANDTSNYDSWANTDLASITEGHDEATREGSGGGIAYAYGIDSTAGAVGNATATADNAANYTATIAVSMNEIIAASVTAVAAAGTATASAPSLSSKVNLTVVAPAGTATASASSITGKANVTAVACAGTATASGPEVTGEVSGDVTVTAVAASATATASGPTLSSKVNLTAVAGAGTATASAPTPTGKAGVTAVSASGTATAESPTLSGKAGVTAVAGAGTATASGPSLAAKAETTAVAGSATATASGPSLSGKANVTAEACAGTASASSPTITVLVSVDATVAAVACAAIASASAPWVRQTLYPVNGIDRVREAYPYTKATGNTQLKATGNLGTGVTVNTLQLRVREGT